MRLLSLYLFSLAFCLNPVTFGQKIDSLSDKSNRYLVEKIENFQFDRSNPLVWVYLDAYINNAKKINNFETLHYGYREAAYFSESQNKMAYSDSALTAAEKTKKKDLIASALYDKGRTYYGFRDYKKTLDYYLKAAGELEDSENKYLKNKIIYGISVVKLYLMYYDEALDGFTQTTRYYKNKDNPDHILMYLRSLFREGEARQALKEYGSAAETNLLGLQESLKHGEKIQEQYFNLAMGIDDYHANEYVSAIRNIQKAIPLMSENGYFEMEQKGYFYIAKSYLALTQPDKALTHFQRIDSLFIANGYLPNELRSAYEWLIDYYKNENEKDKQLYYINQLLEVDKANAENNRYLAYKVHKEYDTQRLTEEKDRLEKRFENWKYYVLSLLIVLSITAAYFFNRSQKAERKNKELRKKYEEFLLRKNTMTVNPDIENTRKKVPKEIPVEIVEDLLNRLEVFEENKEFLNPKTEQRYLAEKFKTNSTYLSKVINTYKETNFNGYINKLRVNYIVDLLLTVPKYRAYTIEALSKEAGFATSRHFSDAFLTETGLRPNYFLEQIKKEKEIPV
jgi:AraC-like DNA-binding protein/uncharacterized short protein YbdD (DUF466 family)